MGVEYEDIISLGILK